MKYIHKARTWGLGLIGFSLVGLSGCATPTYNYVPTVQNISRPPLNSITTVGVGEQMLIQGHFVERDALILERDIKVGTLGSYTFTAGHFVRLGGNGDVGFYNSSLTPGTGSVQVGALADPFQVIEYNSATKQICGVSTLNMKVCREAPDARIEKISTQRDNSFQQTLIYSGRVGNKVNIGYREFSSNMARPAFNNDVEYDLNESNIIGYKGAQIEIIDATNQRIQYRVLQNFNDASR